MSEGTVRVINASKCRRELVLDEQTYTDASGKLLKDVNDRAVQPLITSVMLEQGANEVDAKFLERVRAADKLRKNPYLEVLFQRRILSTKPVLTPTIDVKDLKALRPEDVEDLSALTPKAAQQIINACNDQHLLREFVDHDPRREVRKMLRDRYREIVPKDEPGIDPTESEV